MASTANNRPPSQPRAPRPAVMPARQIRWYAMAARMWRRPPGLLTLVSRLILWPLVPVALWLHVLYGWPAALAGAMAVAFAASHLPRLSRPQPLSAANAGAARPAWHVRALLGERMLLNRIVVPVPGSATRNAGLLLVATACGAALALIAGFAGDLGSLLIGLGLGLAAQVVHLGLASRLYAQMRDADALYRAWQRPATNDNRAGSQKPGQAA